VKDAIVWLALIELLGLAGFPLVFSALRFLPDRGYSFSKTVGLLLVSYLVWLGASVRLFPNDRLVIVLMLLLTGVVAGIVGWNKRREILEFARARKGYLIAAEVLFVGSFALALFLRSYVAEFQEASGEKPMDAMLINAVLRSDHFPPKDPWLAGYDVNYYYFGHLMMAMLTKLSGIASYVTFNLGLGLLTALSASAAFGLVYNLVAGRARERVALGVALLAPLLLLVVSNVEGLFELLAVHGVGGKGFYDLIDVTGLDGARDSPEWYPTEFLWMLRSINYVTGQVDHQFPYYKFMQGEVHSETLAIPFVLLATAAALNVWRSPTSARPGAWWRDPALFALSAFALGSVTVVQSWYAPAFYLVLAAAFALRGYLAERRFSRGFLAGTLSYLVALPLASVALYLPFFQTNFGSFDGIAVEGQVADKAHHLLYMWLPLFWLAGSLAVVGLWGLRWKPSAIAVAAALPLLVVGPWALLLIAGEGTVPFSTALDNVSSAGSALSLLILLGLLAVASLAAFRELAPIKKDGELPASVFALLLMAVALLVITGVQFFSVKDFFWVRYNTLIKANYIAWFLLSISGAFAAYYVLSRGGSSRPVMAAKAGWTTVTVLILAVALIFPVLTTFSTSAGFKNERHLNLLWKWERFAPGEYEAVQWLWENVEGTPTITEAVGDAWSVYGRVSAYSGLPTVLGWPSHEMHWRGGSWDPQAGRREAVERIYKTTDAAEAKALLQQYGVEYVYVGSLERQAYGEAGLEKFRGFMDIAYENSQVVIYRMPEATAAVSQP